MRTKDALANRAVLIAINPVTQKGCDFDDVADAHVHGFKLRENILPNLLGLRFER